MTFKLHEGSANKEREREKNGCRVDNQRVCRRQDPASCICVPSLPRHPHPVLAHMAAQQIVVELSRTRNYPVGVRKQ